MRMCSAGYTFRPEVSHTVTRLINGHGFTSPPERCLKENPSFLVGMYPFDMNVVGEIHIRTRVESTLAAIWRTFHGLLSLNSVENFDQNYAWLTVVPTTRVTQEKRSSF